MDQAQEALLKTDSSRSPANFAVQLDQAMREVEKMSKEKVQNLYNSALEALGISKVDPPKTDAGG